MIEPDEPEIKSSVQSRDRQVELSIEMIEISAAKVAQFSVLDLYQIPYAMRGKPINAAIYKGLFGIFNHEIPLQNPDRVTIIHGPNGFGKTVMLRMIAAVIEGENSIFEQTPFTEFGLTLDDGTSRIIRRHVSAEAESGKPRRVKTGAERSKPRRVKLEFLTRDAKGNTEAVLPSSPSFEVSDIPHTVLERVDRLVPSPYRLRADGWSAPGESRVYSFGEILQKFPEASIALPKKYRPNVFFEDLQLFFVETNRLGGEPRASDSERLESRSYVVNYADLVREREGPVPFVPRVKQYSNDIQQRIHSVLAEYAKYSQESDRTYPERLVKFVRDRQDAISESEILNRMAEFEKIRQRLISFGLLDSESGLRDLTEEDVNKAPAALTIYVGDVQEKLKVFDDLAERIGSLMDIVNDRFKYKRLKVDREKGFSVLSDLNQPVALENLSSGEQHELVVLYELLFRAPKNGLVLVDEPEISLHVAWQSRFLSDLIGILAVTDAYAIVATHSPVIIGTRRDLAVELKGPEQ